MNPVLRWAAGVFAIVGICAGTTSCRSFHSRKVVGGDDGRDIGGVPVLVQVPRYLKVTYKTADYVVAARSVGTESESGAKVGTWQVLGYDRRPEVTTEVVAVGELFSVDVERPFAGTAKNKVEFQDGGHALKSVANDVDDKTLEQATKTLDTLVKPFVPGAAKPQASDAARSSEFEVVKVRETIDRIEFRDIHDPSCLIASYCPTSCEATPRTPATSPAAPTLLLAPRPSPAPSK